MTKRQKSIDTTVTPRETIITNELKITIESWPRIPRKKPTPEKTESWIQSKKLVLDFCL